MSSTIREQQFNEYIKRLSFWDQFVLSKTYSKLDIIRHHFANKYLSGDGIEIGAQFRPIQITNNKANVKYVDRISREKTSEIYGLPVDSLIEPDYCLEADNLHIFPNNSLDFIVANHVLEHTEDPIGTLVEWFRVVKEQGTLFITAPNYRSNEYDFRRKPVNLEHLISDYYNPSPSKKQQDKVEHWREFITNVMDLTEDEPKFEKTLKDYIHRDERTHFHVYDLKLLEQILNCIHNTLRIRIRVINTFYLGYSFEILMVLQKSNSHSKPPQLADHFRSMRNLALFLYFAISTGVIEKHDFEDLQELNVKKRRMNALQKGVGHYFRVFRRDLREHGLAWALKRSFQWLRWIFGFGNTSTQNLISPNFLNFGGTGRQLLTSPQSEQLRIATDIIFSKLDSSDLESLEKLLKEMSDPRFELPDFLPEHRKQEIIRLGNYLLPQIFNEKTGLISRVPPSHVHDMSKPLGVHCGSLYYADLVTEVMYLSGRSIERNKNYLDFGCSSGRVVRVLKAAYPESNWFGCDPITDAIEWAKENLEGIKFFNSSQVPPLPYDDNQFSMVYAISIWSHFSEKAAMSWFKEVHRIIEPSGLLIFSTHGLNTLKYYHQNRLKPETEIQELSETLINLGYCYEDVFRYSGDYGLDCSDWGSCYLLPEWILKNLLNNWKLLLYQVGRAELNQDVYVLEKR